jgi:formate C-acetyltransferase
VDQYTWPYLKKELEAGTITMDQAQEILDCFYMKINGMYAAAGAPSSRSRASATPTCTTPSRRGQGRQRRHHPVTYMVLESVCRLYLHDPTISCGTTKTPRQPVGAGHRDLAPGGGPAPVPERRGDHPGAVRELGFSLEDARDYAIVGCQEITGSGK